MKARKGWYDAIFVCRPHNMETFVDALEQVPGAAAGAAVFYDAEALFSPRDAVKRAIEGRPLKPGEAARELAREMALTRHAHAVISVSPSERAVFERHGVARSWVLGHAIAPHLSKHGADSLFWARSTTTSRRTPRACAGSRRKSCRACASSPARR
jgi:hypothetical protein